MRALLYRNLEQNFTPSELTDPQGAVSQPELFSSMIAEAQKDQKETLKTITTGAPPNTISENFDAIPLAGRGGDLLGVLLVGSSRENLLSMLNFIRILALMVGGGVIILGMVLGWWISARVTRPIEELAAGARDVAAGHWRAHVQVHSRDEVGQLATAFNEMTRQLSEQREQLVQTERVAAWRELARRLAHELKNPLFPLQLTVENLQRAREQTAEQFDEVFFESTATLRAELENLKTIVSRFSDFAKMPTPEFEPVDLNDLVRSAVKLFEPQLAPVGRPPITPELYLDEKLPKPQADPILLRRAFENLILNSLDAMPAGGTLTIRTAHREGAVRLEVTDTGEGLSPEECARLFTPYYTTKRHGTGLGLAIVQSVVSDHSGRIEVESAPGAGATFRIELPIEQKSSLDKMNLDGEKPVDPPVFTTV
jgi:nitrogen fixation/metabolism regulation signal transduction histidine kinase